jgi:hypothetical protein
MSRPKTKTKAKKTDRKILRVLYVEVYEPAEVEAIDAVAVRSAQASGRPVTIAEVTRQLFLDTNAKKTPVVVEG